MAYETKYDVKRHLKQNIDFLKSADMSHLIPNFVEFSDILDQRQNVQHTWRDLLPDLAQEIEKS